MSTSEVNTQHITTFSPALLFTNELAKYPLQSCSTQSGLDTERMLTGLLRFTLNSFINNEDRQSDGFPSHRP